MLATGFYFYDGTNYYKFAGQYTKWHQYFQMPIKADEMVIRIDGNTIKPPLGEVVYCVEGVHLFHGIITYIDDMDNYTLLTCKSMQYLLDYSVIPYNVYHDVDLNTILASDAPATVMGILFLINGYIPNGKWEYYSATVQKLADAGLKSCFGALPLYASTSYPNAGSIDACDGVVQLTDAGAIPSAANQYYRTNDDLYVRFGDGSYRENAYIVAALNWKDTRIRLGNVAIGAYKCSADFSLDGQASTSLDDFFKKLGQEIEFLPWHDFTLRLQVASEIPGRSSESNPIRDYRDGENNAKVTFTDSETPDVQAAVSYGGDVTQCPQVVSDWSWRGPQLIKGYENRGYTQEEILQILQDLIDNNEVSCKVVTTEVDEYLRPGDWVSAYREDRGYFALRIKEKEISENKMTLTLGKKISTASEIFGEYLRGIIQDEANLRISTNIIDGTGTFTVTEETYALGGLKIYYEESISEATDGTTISQHAFIMIKVNGTVIPPGRIRLNSDSSNLKIDITDYCTLPGTNTIERIFDYATGWVAADAAQVNQYLAIQFFAP